jgi:hypothetical protein
MVIYNCTTTESTLSAEQKSELANEIIGIRSAFNHVPVTHINVVCLSSYPSTALNTGGVPASPLLVSSLFRAGHPESETKRRVAEMADAVTRVTGITADRIISVAQTTPTQFALVHGRFFPDSTGLAEFVRANCPAAR